jgi:mono/diheme cytochrome c family protein
MRDTRKNGKTTKPQHLGINRFPEERHRLWLSGLSLVLLLALAAAAGCGGRGAATSATPSLAAAAGGAELWADNCARCHNMRPSDQYSAKEWGIVMLHMRVRSGLTGEEGRAIRAFLQGGQ